MNNFRFALNFWFSEMIASNIAKRFGIDNRPRPEHIAAATALALFVLQPLRDYIRQAIHFTSWYRCPELNSHPDVGGSETSDHLSGAAADIYTAGYTPEQLGRLIHELGLPVHQCIAYPNKGIVHVSFRRLDAEPDREFMIDRSDGAGPVTWNPDSDS